MQTFVKIKTNNLNNNKDFFCLGDLISLEPKRDGKRIYAVVCMNNDSAVYLGESPDMCSWVSGLAANYDKFKIRLEVRRGEWEMKYDD